MWVMAIGKICARFRLRADFKGWGLLSKLDFLEFLAPAKNFYLTKHNIN